MTLPLSRCRSVFRGCPAADVWAWVVVGLIGVHTVLFGSMQLMSGDDAGYSRSLMDYDGEPLAYIRYVARHYVYVNGRMANLLAPFWLSEVPRWLLDVANGVMCAGFYAMTLVSSGLAGRHTATAKIAVTALLLFTFPWWDSFMLFDVMFNYVWSSVLVLAVLWLLLRGVPSRWRWGAWVLSAFAASMHEGIGLPVSAGVVVWLKFSGSWRNLSEVQRGMIVAFFCGTLFALLSPGIWGRLVSEGIAMGEREPNDVLWLLLIKSDFYALLLVAFIGAAALWRRGNLMEMARSPWIIFVTASLIGVCMSGVSGIVGRSGWFASLMAVIAMAQWGCRYGWHIRGKAGAVASGVLSVLMICHMAVVDVVQWRMRSELVSALTSYIRNPHEPVYMDYLPWDTWRWLTLAKVRGVPEPYEQSQLQHYASLYVSEDAPLMVVLPAEAENKEVASGGMAKVGDGFLTASLPEPAHPEDATYVIGGRHYIPVGYVDKNQRQMYYLAPLNLRCGDRMHYLPAIKEGVWESRL